MTDEKIKNSSELEFAVFALKCSGKAGCECRACLSGIYRTE